MLAETSMETLVFVRLMRKWSAARASGENPLPPMQAMILPFEPSPDLALACSSLFDLVEAHLGRSLVPDCCCSQALSRDEEALLSLLRHAPEAGQPMTGAGIPHGLPGAIRWAAFAVIRALAATFGETPTMTSERQAPVVTCPFGEARPQLALAPAA